MARSEPIVMPGVAAVALIVGVFAPLADVDVYGSVSLFDVSELQGLLLLAVAAGTLLAVLTSGARWLPLWAVGAWAGLFYPLLERWLTPRDDSALGQLKEALTSAASNAFSDVASDIAMDYTHLRWGGVALVGGCTLLSVVALRRR